MARKNPMKVNLRKASRNIAPAHKKALTQESSESLINARIEKRQEAIDHYNFVECNEISPEFNKMMSFGDDLIIRLHKENYIKGITHFADGENTYECWISQVDGRMRKTDPERWVDNPLPYIHRGVICYISPKAKDYFKKTKKSMEATDKNIAKTFKLPEVGDVVDLKHFMFADARFYMNKQQRDFIRNPEEWSIVNWEGYVRVHYSQLESLYKDFKDVEKTSPYYMMKKEESND